MTANTILGTYWVLALIPTPAQARALRHVCRDHVAKLRPRYLGLWCFSSALKTHGLDSTCSFIPKRTEDVLKELLPNFSLASLQIPPTRDPTLSCSLLVPSHQNHAQLMAGAQ